MSSKCVILHVEDNDNDSFLFQRALTHLHFAGVYRRVRNIIQAREYLTRMERFAAEENFPDPTLIVTDMALANDGTAADLARWLRQRPECTTLPLIVFTGAADLNTQHAALNAGADAVLLKGAVFEDLVLKVREIVAYCPEVPE